MTNPGIPKPSVFPNNKVLKSNDDPYSTCVKVKTLPKF